jgi:hypothetical protein
MRAILIGVGLLAIAGTSTAAGDFMSMPTQSTAYGATAEVEPRDDSWYREQSVKPDTKTIIQQKAMVRGQQRADRMASMQWYGMSNSRPQAASTPFSTRYSPAWEMPGGKPYSWYPNSRPGYVLYWR